MEAKPTEKELKWCLSLAEVHQLIPPKEQKKDKNVEFIIQSISTYMLLVVL